eukprot:765415-Hanusia_phi.AAC.2
MIDSDPVRSDPHAPPHRRASAAGRARPPDSASDPVTHPGSEYRGGAPRLGPPAAAAGAAGQ